MDGTNAGRIHSPVISDLERLLPHPGILQVRIHCSSQDVDEALVLLDHPHHEERAEVLYGRSCHDPILPNGRTQKHITVKFALGLAHNSQTTADCFKRFQWDKNQGEPQHVEFSTTATF